MTIKQTKEYLAQYRETIAHADETAAHLAELKAEAVRLRDHEGQTVELDAAVAKYVDACADAAIYLDMLADRRKAIKAIIDAVPDAVLRDLLYQRYINGLTWERIAVAMNYSYQHTVHFLHPRALAFAKHLIESNI